MSSLVGWVLGGLGSCGAVLFLVPFLAPCTGFIFAAGCVAGVITGHIARSQIRAGGGAQTGQGMALAGLVLGWIGVGLLIVAVCLGLMVIVVLALLGPAIGNVFSNIMIDL